MPEVKNGDIFRTSNPQCFVNIVKKNIFLRREGRIIKGNFENWIKTTFSYIAVPCYADSITLLEMKGLVLSLYLTFAKAFLANLCVLRLVATSHLYTHFRRSLHFWRKKKKLWLKPMYSLQNINDVTGSANTSYGINFFCFSLC